MNIDDKEENLNECTRKGCRGLFLSDIKTSQRYPNAKSAEDIWVFYQSIIQTL